MAAAVSSPQTALAAVIQCKHQLQLPHTLEQCLHSFCKICLDGITKKTRENETGWFCPSCSSFSQEDEIRKNSFIEDLITISKCEEDNDKTEKEKCKQCPKQDKEATGKCTDCKIELCNDCRISHLQIPILSNHTIENIDELYEKVIDKLMFCTVHKTSPLEYNCIDCEEHICQTCNVFGHNSHTIETMNQAIDRLQPQLESNVDTIRSNIISMETQIKIITKEIEQTKESYASCRIEMDESLETLINRLKAMKAEMEDEVTEQETVALDILENIKCNLENQLSLAKNLTNLVEVTTDKARHTSFLHEMQSGLYSKVEQTSNTQQKSVEFQIMVPEFKDQQNLKVRLDELQELIGELSYNEPKCNVDEQGIVWTANEFMCENFRDICDKEHKKELNIDLDVLWSQRLSYFNNKLWIACPGDGKINAYNKTGELVNIIETKKQIAVIKKVNNGDIIAAGQRGMYITNNDCSEWKKLSEGVFNNLCVHNNKFSVLDYQKRKVMTFSLSTKSDNNVWLEESSIQVDEAVDVNSTLIVYMDANYLVCTGESIFKYSSGGHLMSKHEDNSYFRLLCSIDYLGNLLTTNFHDGGIYVFNIVKDLSSSSKLPTSCCNSTFKGKELRDVVIDSERSIWFLEGNVNKTYRLVKFKPI